MVPVGYLIVIGCVVGGYLLEGGHILVLWQPIELLIIGGAALGSLVISSPTVLIKDIIAKRSTLNF
jgi:chemotaxis protein MotA